MNTRRIGTILKWALIALVVILAALQFIRPARTNPAIDEARKISARMSVTPEVAAILDRSCNDCHSNQTRWPWYSNIAPVSWFVINHVNEGRDNMNFSDWAQYDSRTQENLLRQSCREVSSGMMPLNSYLWLHRGATLSSEDVKTLCDWVNAETRR